MTTAAQPNPVVLTNAAQVRNLNQSQAALAMPVRLRGVVIDPAAPIGAAVIIADASAGLYVLGTTNQLSRYHRSDFLEVTGVTDPGQFAPIVKASAVRKIGTAPIPPPRPVTYQELITGALDGQWVEVSGVVHRCLEPARTNDYWRIYLAVNGGMLSARVRSPRNLADQDDAKVRVQAVCLGQFNQKRQLITPVLQVPEHVNVEVIKPAPAFPYDAPLRPADSLLQFSPENTFGHRVHVHGMVTHARAGGHGLDSRRPCGFANPNPAAGRARRETGLKCSVFRLLDRPRPCWKTRGSRKPAPGRRRRPSQPMSPTR